MAAALGALAPSSSFAEGGWLPPVKLTETNAVDPQVGVFPNGEAIVAWGPKAPSSAEAGGSGIEFSSRGADGRFGPAQAAAPAGSIIPALAVNELGRSALTWYGDPAAAALRAPGGGFGPAQAVTDGDAEVAIDGAGNGYVVASRANFGPSGTASLAVATLPVDGGPTQVRDVARMGHIFDPTIASGAAGRVTVAWQGGNEGEPPSEARVYTATAEPGGTFSAPSPISDLAYNNITSGGELTRTLTNARGDTFVAWSAIETPNPRPDLPDYRHDQVLFGAFRRAGGSFGTPERVPLPDERRRGIIRWDAAIGPSGEVLAAWSDGLSVSMTYRPPGGPFEPARPADVYPECCSPTTAPRAAQLDPAAALDPAGNGMVAYTSGSWGDMRLNVVRRPRGEGFLPPQSVVAAPHLFTPDIALDAAGNGLIAWSPQERTGSAGERKDRGLYAAAYDAKLAPAVTTIAPARRRFGVEVTESGRAALVVKRKRGRRWARVFAARKRVVPGYNLVELPARHRKALSRRGRYLAEAHVVDADGKRSKLRRRAFRVR